MLVYATPEDYETVMQVSVTPDNIASLLRSASLLLRDETIADYYTVDDSGAPTDADITEAFKEATCFQAGVWSALGIDPNLAGVDATSPKRGKGIGSARVDYDTSAQTSALAIATRQAVINNLCPDAVRTLRQAGLLTSRVWTYG